MKMTDPKILLHDVAHFEDLFDALNFQLREFGGGRILAHDAISDLIL